MHELGNPNTYKSNTKKVNSVLKTLYELVNDEPYTKRVKVYTEWGKFLKASTCQDVIDKRIVLLEKIFHCVLSEIIKDYCGTLNVKAIRANLFLVHELLDENLDY